MRTKSSEFFFFEALGETVKLRLISWIRNNLMHEYEEKKEARERGKRMAPKGACNCSQGCIAEVKREGPRGGHEGGKRTTLCARQWVDGGTEGKARIHARVHVYVCTCASVSGCVCNRGNENPAGRACERKHKGE